LKQFKLPYFCALLIGILTFSQSTSQMITGTWKGRINKKKVELKIIQNGDSLTGTSYYYESPDNYRRYTIRGYFDQQTNEAVWWDDELVEEKTGKNIFGGPGKIPYLSSADFNCPGSGKMFLEGKAALRDDERDVKGPVDLEKTATGMFPDEWDFVIDNYTSGANDPYIIDSIASIAKTERETERATVREPEVAVNRQPANNTVFIPVPRTEEKKIMTTKPVTIEEKFVKRERIFTKEIPMVGDSIELHFYDNAEIDGDSISLFLNEKLIFQHIRLTGNAYKLKLSIQDLKEVNELIMVAENLGEIPPNTSYMIALVDGKRYDAQLASTEQSSALIRLVKPKSP
jgi:hypothetical protein